MSSGHRSIFVEPHRSPDGVRRLTEDQLDQARNLLRVEGAVILPGIVPAELVARLRDTMLADLARREHPLPINFVTGHIQQDPPPVPELLFPEVLLNESVYRVSTALLGPDAKNAVYSGNINLPGSLEQPVHLDEGHLWPGPTEHPPYALEVDIPLIDFTVHNGTTEYWLGTHQLNPEGWYDDAGRVETVALEQRRAVRPPQQFAIPAGSAVIRDARLWHRGTVNRSSSPRPMVAMTHYCDWFETPPIVLPSAVRPWIEASPYRTSATFTDEPIDHLTSEHAFAIQ
ncbi:phytanoyl-CoA dioxygenase family protein [Micromonospora echinospora]|uniref:phytanoyl-CoA dioxygenase family protein n=1 Tax=Micromonospora echinospora TaxID=1877 RepID=UPI00379E87DC